MFFLEHEDDFEVDDFLGCPSLDPIPANFSADFKNPCYYTGDDFLCVPLVFLAGSSHGGAEDLYKDLVQHKQVVKPDTQQPNWWTRPDPFAAPYSMYFQDAAEKIEKHHDYITVDGSLSTLWNNRHMFAKFMTVDQDPELYLADCIKHQIPNAKIILMLRDPVTNFYYDYLKSEELGKQSPEGFHMAAKNSIKRFQECVSDERFSEEHCIYSDGFDDLLDGLRAGIYVRHVQHFLKAFSEKQVLVLSYWKELEDGIVTVERVHSFLGLDNVSRDEIASYIHYYGFLPVQPRKVFASTLRMLRDFYQPFNEELAALLNGQEILDESMDEDWEFCVDWGFDVSNENEQDIIFQNIPDENFLKM